MSVHPNPALWRAGLTAAVTGLTVLATAAPGLAGQTGRGQGASADEHNASSQHAHRAEPTGSDTERQDASDEATPQPAASEGRAADEHDPPGNNGTVFIHDTAGDHRPHNVPHVGCTFYVDFFGFDDGQTVTMSFAGQAPTGAGTPLGGGWTGTVSKDAAGGAGNDFDDELTVSADSLGLDRLGAPAKQGYHVKLTVATNEPGGKKSKVFWVQPCTAAGVVSPARASGAAVRAGSVSRPAATSHAVQASVLGETFTRAGATGSGATGAAGATGAVAADSAARSGTLPFTGANVAEMALGAAGLLAGGAGLTVAGRRRRSRAHA